MVQDTATAADQIPRNKEEIGFGAAKRLYLEVMQTNIFSTDFWNGNLRRTSSCQKDGLEK